MNLVENIKDKLKSVSPSKISFTVIIAALFTVAVIALFYRYIMPVIKDARDKIGGGAGMVDTDPDEKNITVYLFYTAWCPHCKSIMDKSGVWEEFKEEYNRKTLNGYYLEVTEVDCDSPDGEVKANKFDIDSYPTIKALKDKEIIEYDAKPSKKTLKAFMKEISKDGNDEGLKTPQDDLRSVSKGITNEEMEITADHVKTSVDNTTDKQLKSKDKGGLGTVGDWIG